MFNVTSVKTVVTVSLLSLLSACGGSESGSGTPPNTVNLSGTVSSINGQVAFSQPSFNESFLAIFIGNKSHAAVDGESSVGAGVTIELIKVDNNGDIIGDVIASATTDASGNYSLEAPEGFVPGPEYVIRAKGVSSSIGARVTDLAQDIDSVSDASSSVISGNAMDLSSLSLSEIDEIHAAVSDVVEDTDATATTVADYRSAIVDATAENEGVSNVVASTVASGMICGSIKDSADVPLENIRIIVRDFGNWVTRAKTKTDANGDYCVNVPVAGDADQYIAGRTHTGEYILGAINYTGNSYAASQWWTQSSTNADGSGGGNSQFLAEKVSVSNTTTVTKDFVLDKDGARIVGNVFGDSDADGTGDIAMEGMRVVIRNYDTFKPLASARVKVDGSYRINVKATDYLISFRNKTRRPFASEVYRAGTDGVTDRNMASRESVIANQNNTYNAVLENGAVISGVVKDNAGVAVSGQVVFVNNAGGGRAETLRTNKNGKFRMWVSPRFNYLDAAAGTYAVWSRGQVRIANTNGNDDVTLTHYKLSQSTGLVFDTQTIQVTGRLLSSDAVPVPVGSAVVRLQTATGTDLQVSSADGSFVMYTTDTAGTTLKLYTRLDDSTNYGSGVYDGSAMSAIAISAGANIDATTAVGGVVALGGISMPTKDIGAGVGYIVGNTAAGSSVAQIRIGGNSNTFNMFKTRSRGDGSFKVTVPATTYNRIRAGGVNCNTIPVVSNEIVNVVFDGLGAATLDGVVCSPL